MESGGPHKLLLEQLTAAIASLMEDHAPLAARQVADPLEATKRFLQLRRAGHDIYLLAETAIAVSRRLSG